MTIGIMAFLLGVSYTIAIFFNIGFLNKKQSKKIINVMTGLFVVLTVIQLSFAILGILNVATLYIPMIFNVMVWGIMFPHILGHGLTFLFGILFKDNFLGISLFTFIMSIITICLVFYFNIANNLKSKFILT